MKLSSRTIMLALTTVVMAGSVFAAPPPPQSPYDTHSSKPLSKTKLATGLKMGSFNVEFEKTTLAMVRNSVGRGEIAHQGDAAASIYWLCYTVHTPDRNERVWIIAHGEMGGAEHAITEITAQIIQPTDDTNDCPSLPAALQPLSFGSGLWLGTQKDRALDILGLPSLQEGAWWVFDYQGTVPGNCKPDGFVVLNRLSFETNRGRLVRIHAGQVTSC